MATSAGDDERLPWLEPPRRTARSRPARAARRPLLILLSLFATASVALLSFLAGRGSAPLPSRAESNPAAIVAPLPPAPGPPVAAALPATAASAASARPKAAAKSKARARSIIHRSKAPRRAVGRKPRRSLIPDIVIHRNMTPPRAPSVAPAALPRQTVAPTQPFVAAPGKVIQLGSFRTIAQTNAAWWRLVRAYPYLGTLPRAVTWVGPTPGRARMYQIKLAAGSRREARALCRNLHRVGRGCAVLHRTK